MATKTTTATRAKRKAPGILPSPKELKAMGHGDLVKVMRKHPEAFAHIRQRSDNPLRRSDKEIARAYKEFWERVWWVRHKVLIHEIETGKVKLEKAGMAGLEIGKKGAARIQRKYGLKNLVLSDFEYGLVSGRMSALDWVMGAEWNESLDT